MFTVCLQRIRPVKDRDVPGLLYFISQKIKSAEKALLYHKKRENPPHSCAIYLRLIAQVSPKMESLCSQNECLFSVYHAGTEYTIKCCL